MLFSVVMFVHYVPVLGGWISLYRLSSSQVGDYSELEYAREIMICHVS